MFSKKYEIEMSFYVYKKNILTSHIESLSAFFMIN